MPFLSRDVLPIAGMTGTVSHVAQNLKQSYAFPGPSIDVQADIPTYFRATNPVGAMPPYGSLAASSGDHLGGALLVGESGCQVSGN